MSVRGQWISPEQLEPILKHYWYTTKVTESNIQYTLYNNRNNVKVYTLRYNLRNKNYSHETMIDDMMSKVMTAFPKSKSVIGNVQYDMLLESTKKDDPGYYLWRANSNQRTASGTEETLLQKEYHQLYIFGQRATEPDIEELANQFQSSSVVIADILTIVFTFTSAWYYEAAAGDGTPEKTTKWKKNQHPKKKKVTS